MFSLETYKCVHLYQLHVLGFLLLYFFFLFRFSLPVVVVFFLNIKLFLSQDPRVVTLTFLSLSPSHRVGGSERAQLLAGVKPRHKVSCKLCLADALGCRCHS